MAEPENQSLFENEVEPATKKRRVVSNMSVSGEVRLLVRHFDDQTLVKMLVRLAECNPSILDDMREELKKETEPTKCKLFVRALSWNTTSKMLRESFEVYGNVTEAVVLENGGRSRGYGFITFSNAYECLMALEQPKKVIDGRDTVCNLASKPDDTAKHNATARGGHGGPEDFRGSSGGSSGSGSGSGPGSASGSGGMTLTDQTRIFVRSLHYGTTSERLEEVFREYGDIIDAAVIKDKATNKSKGYGFVTFKEPEAAVMALREPEKDIDGRMAYCNLASERKRGVPSAQPPVSQSGLQYITQPMALSQQAAAAYPQGWATTSYAPVADYRTAAAQQYYLPMQSQQLQAAQAQAALMQAQAVQAQASAQQAQQGVLPQTSVGVGMPTQIGPQANPTIQRY